MGILEKLFGPPDIEKLKKNFDYKGLAKALGHRDAEVRRRAAEALTLDESVLEGFRGTLERFEVSEFFQRAAAMARKHGHVDMGGEAIPVLRFPARILGNMGDAEAIGSLISVLSDKDAGTRAQAAKALGRLRLAARTFARDHPIEPFSDLIASIDARAGRVLRTLSHERASIVEKLMALRSDHDGLVRKEAETALKQFGEEQPSTAGRGECGIPALAECRQAAEMPSKEAVPPESGTRRGYLILLWNTEPLSSAEEEQIVTGMRAELGCPTKLLKPVQVPGRFPNGPDEFVIATALLACERASIPLDRERDTIAFRGGMYRPGVEFGLITIVTNSAP